MQGPVILLIIVTAVSTAWAQNQAPVSAPKPAPDLALIVSPPGTGESFTIELRAQPQEAGVDIKYIHAMGAQIDVTEKSFDADTLKQLRALWGAQRFDILRIKSELGCSRSVTWKLKAGGHFRVVCRNEALISKLGELQSTIQLLMQ